MQPTILNVTFMVSFALAGGPQSFGHAVQVHIDGSPLPLTQMLGHEEALHRLQFAINRRPSSTGSFGQLRDAGLTARPQSEVDVGTRLAQTTPPECIMGQLGETVGLGVSIRFTHSIPPTVMECVLMRLGTRSLLGVVSVSTWLRGMVSPQ